MILASQMREPRDTGYLPEQACEQVWLQLNYLGRSNGKAKFLPDTSLSGGWRTHRSHRSVPRVFFDNSKYSTGRSAKSIKASDAKLKYSSGAVAMSMIGRLSQMGRSNARSSSASPP